MYNINKEAFEELMKSKKLNMSKLAKLMNISRSQVSKVVNGNCSPGGKFIASFQAAFPKASLKKYFFVKGVA